MRKTVHTEKIPIKLWLEDMEDGAMQQAKNLANLPFAFHHIAIMPDAHFGFGMPIGGILAADSMIVPNAVGVDIGCGMCAVKTSADHIDEDTLKSVMQTVRRTVPLGFKHHRSRQPHDAMPAVEIDSLPMVRSEYENARQQVGTLGGGNHFIEIQRGADGAIWFMIHSGSRNIGFRFANHYNKLAISLNKKWKSPLPPSWQLAYLPMDSEAGQSYFREMDYCVKFAEANRDQMRKRVEQALLDHTAGIRFAEPINIAHNYAAREHHFGKTVYVHRKGATRATTLDTGIIPGSQGNVSFIVSGKSNPDSFHSCSHGAGRKLGRKQAQRQLDLGEERRRLEGKNILHSLRGKHDLDEAPGAYKDIETVIENQRDLIDIVDILQPLAVIKG